VCTYINILYTYLHIISLSLSHGYEAQLAGEATGISNLVRDIHSSPHIVGRGSEGGGAVGKGGGEGGGGIVFRGKGRSVVGQQERGGKLRGGKGV
jgi:hypothetical protein